MMGADRLMHRMRDGGEPLRLLVAADSLSDVYNIKQCLAAQVLR